MLRQERDEDMKLPTAEDLRNEGQELMTNVKRRVKVEAEISEYVLHWVHYTLVPSTFS